MKKLSLFFLLIVIVFICATTNTHATPAEVEKKCIPFSQITSVVFQPGMTTTRRRTPNQPRMTCVGNCPENAQVSSASCKQQGLSDNGLPSWKCVGSFVNSGGDGDNHQYRLGNVRVACEGCNKAGDSDVVAGSCILKYSVESRMKQRRNRNHPHQQSFHSSSTTTRSHYGDGSSSLSFIDLMIIIFVCVGTCYCCSAINRERERRRRQQYNEDYVVEGVAVQDNKTLHNNQQQQQQQQGGVHHHHYGNRGGDSSSGGSGFGGFWNGLFLGSIMSGGMFGGGYHSSNNNTTINNYYDDDGGSSGWGGGGDDGWSGGGGWGDSVSD